MVLESFKLIKDLHYMKVYKSDDTLVQIFNENTYYLSSEEFIKCLSWVSDYANKSQVKYILIDFSKNLYITSIHDQDWIENNHQKITVKSLKKMGVIHSKDMVCELSEKQTLEELAPHIVYDVKAFTDIGVALEWMN